MFKFAAVSIVAVGMSICMMPTTFAADLFTTPPAESDIDRATAETSLREALSEYLSLLMVRATFDVVDRTNLEANLNQQLQLWGGRPPVADARADLDRQLLAEGSYFLVSLSYTVKVGGAAFPGDKAEMVYANDTISELDDLQRELFDAVATGVDTLPVFMRAEQIRALTEGETDVPDDLAVFKDHAAILDRVIKAAARETRT